MDNNRLEAAYRAARIAVFAKQAFAGSKVAFGAIFMAFLLIRPALGTGVAALWTVVTAAAFVWRDRIVKQQLDGRELTSSIESRIGWASLLVGLCIHSPSPWVVHLLSDDQRGIYIAMIVVWIALAAMELGLLPRSYRVYIPISLGLLAVGVLRALPETLALTACALLLAAGIFLISFSNLLVETVQDAVRANLQKDDLVTQLTESIRATEEAQQAKSRFLAAASHDLLQPVHALMMLVDVVKRSPDGEIGRTALARIGDTSQVIDGMFRGLLDQARLDAGAVAVRRSPVDLAMVMNSIVAAYAPQCATKGVSLTVDVPSDTFVTADATLLDRCLRNVLDNAVKFTEHGRIRVVAALEGTNVRIDVVDTGPGIPPDDLERVFDVFYRGSAPQARRVEGAGLGLSNAKQFVDLMGGQIVLRSAPQEGTSVCIRLPANGADPGIVASTAATDIVADVPSRKVLLIEDDVIASDAMALWLQDRGMQVLTATGLRDALVRCAHADFKPELILSDWHLSSDPDGIAAIKALRGRFGQVAAALITGEPPHRIPSGLDIPVLHKPADPKALIQLLALGATAGPKAAPGAT